MINKLFNNQKFIVTIWILLALITSVKQYFINKINNYLIFKNVFYNTIEQKSLYATYPNLYFDHNHYGPIFSLFIAPFALMPDFLGTVLWCVFNALFLVYAIRQINLESSKINLILWICAHEFLTAILGQQFNPIMTSIIILSYVLIEKEKDFWSACLIILGTFIKLYGIVGLAFFFFSKNKIKFISSLAFWSIVFFVLPMAISSPEFIINSYSEWFARLVEKNNENTSFDSMQDISIMGMVKKILNMPNLSNLLFLIPGLVLFGLPYLRFNMFSNKKFQLLLLSSVLIFTVIFSSGSESPTYIIAFAGVAIWFVIQEEKTKWTWFLFIFAMLLTSFSPSDLFPKFIKETYVRPYSLKALPCVLIWFQIIYELLTLKKESNSSIAYD
ncbi:glycosyltransferase family 87 protein [Flavobacterium sp.]|uniref:glycosyltransferase family 87 protein n=1 Tax=Flavobacterium sp. TaxID=239 RepID=UPI00333F4228